jgi:membrane protease YdiL (CAAX protease family)
MSEVAGVAKTIFINDEGELRCGWRILAFMVAFLILTTMIAVLVAAFAMLSPAFGSLFAGRDHDASGLRQLARSFVETTGLLTAAGAASLLCARLLERRTFSSVGYKLHPGWFHDLALGLVLGAITLAIAVGTIAAAGAVSFEVQSGAALRIALGFAGLGLYFLLAAAFEELLVRGFVFQAIAHNVGPVAAIAITSVAFSLLHIGNPNVTIFAILNTVLAGVWLGVAYWLTRSLWLATALHASWNFAMVWIFGLPVSGLTAFVDFACLRGRPGMPVWLSGGDYGPEAGFAATIALALSTIAIGKSGVFRASLEMLAALRHGTPATKNESETFQLELKEPN